MDRPKSKDILKILNSTKVAQLCIKVQDGKAKFLVGNDGKNSQSPKKNDIRIYRRPVVRSISNDNPSGKKVIPVYTGTKNSTISERVSPPCTDTDYGDVSIVDSEDEESFINQYLCSECGAQFHTKEELERHESVHLGEVNYICDQCGKEFSTKKDLDVHLRMHASEKKFECDACHKKFDYRDNLIFHMRIHGENRSYKCLYCSKKFGNKSLRDEHLAKHFPTIKENPTPAHNVNKVSEVPSEGRFLPYPCDMCNASFIYKQGLENHKLIHIQHQRGPKLEVKRLKKKPEEMKLNYTCPRCNKGFFKKHFYKCHLAVCKIPRFVYPAFTCDVCSKVFKSKDDLLEHKVVHVELKKKYNAAKKHVVQIRPKSPIPRPVKIRPDALEAVYSCPRCFKGFIGNRSYKSHLAVCGNPYAEGLSTSNSVECAFCKKMYNVPHPQKDDGSQGAKFICEPCCTILAQKSQVSGFTPRLENRFICNKCEQCYSTEQDLRRHLKFHGPEKASPCSKYESHFDNEADLEEHLESHIYPFKDDDLENTATPKTTSDEKYVNGKSVRNIGSGSKDNVIPSTSSEGYGSEDNFTPSTSSESSVNARSPHKLSKLCNDEECEDSDSNDVDMECHLPEAEMPEYGAFIKQEVEDHMDVKEIDMLENCTVFNVATPKENNVGFTIPDRLIKQEPTDEEESLFIKQEKLDVDDDMTFKEEYDMDLFGHPIKEEKLDSTSFIDQDEFEFTPFGDPIKKEELELFNA